MDEYFVMPSGQYPSEEDYLAGNISSEWVAYFQAIFDSFDDDQKAIILNWENDRQEAKDWYGILRDGGISLSEKDEYLKAFPINARQQVHLVVLQMEKDAPDVEHGKKFTGKKMGAQADHTKEIYELATKFYDLSAKELYSMVTNPNAKALSQGRFANVVSEARKKQ